VIGGAAIDIVSKSDSLSQGSVGFHMGKVMLNVGGTSRNISECLGRLGNAAQVVCVSNVGDDEFTNLV